VGKRKATRAKFGGLTRRQVEVLKLVAEGMTNQQIAETLYISPRTVDMHVSNVLSELGCRSRAEAVHKASELGLLT
jgi:DNA-binding NarL/FixJ family response regulator